MCLGHRWKWVSPSSPISALLLQWTLFLHKGQVQIGDCWKPCFSPKVCPSVACCGCVPLWELKQQSKYLLKHRSGSFTNMTKTRWSLAQRILSSQITWISPASLPMSSGRLKASPQYGCSLFPSYHWSMSSLPVLAALVCTCSNSIQHSHAASSEHCAYACTMYLPVYLAVSQSQGCQLQLHSARVNRFLTLFTSWCIPRPSVALRNRSPAKTMISVLSLVALRNASTTQLQVNLPYVRNDKTAGLSYFWRQGWIPWLVKFNVSWPVRYMWPHTMFSAVHCNVTDTLCAEKCCTFKRSCKHPV